MSTNFRLQRWRPFLKLKMFFLNILFLYIYYPNPKMTHKIDGFIKNLMKMPARLALLIHVL